MSGRIATIFCLLLTVRLCLAQEPDRSKGLSVHMLPDRVAHIGGSSGGFVVRGLDGKEAIYSDAIQLVAFFQTLSVSTKENGIWVVTTSPSAYSEIERANLKTLVALCDEKKIPIFTCRGSELPNGWKRSDVPTDWNNSAATH
jgi:hypothetical protein